eukprot:TRINITY_DN5095_c0_g1_i2.p1 TRINITY_DN5095_c0_g1~~TRINITY_DN5095_c0_g1_i2.p1  ORF type:complete len:385 (-),score=70.28 TRINITY_DN5095_c0_g1_i2:53-1207(-)
MIRGMNKDERDVLRESIYSIQNTWKKETLIEDMDSDGEDKKSEVVARPKIVCQTLYSNAAITEPQVPLEPRVGAAKEMANIFSADNKQARGKLPAVFKSAKKRQSKALQPKKSESLVDRLMKLDKTRIEKMMELLNDIETSNPSSHQSKPTAQILHTAPLSKHSKLSSVAQKTKRNELVIRVLSTWGHPHVAGLTEVELYDNEGKKIEATLTVRHLGSGPTQPVERLVNGKMYTNDEKLMWIAYLPLPPKQLELVFTLPTAPDGVIIWNYNKSSIDSVKGVREAEILLNGTLVWSGSVRRGQGRVKEDYSTEIVLGKRKDVFRDRPRAEKRKIKALVPFPEVKKESAEEKGIDDLSYFEASKPQRLLHKKTEVCLLYTSPSPRD